QDHTEAARKRLAQKVKESTWQEIWRRAKDRVALHSDEARHRIAAVVDAAWRPTEALAAIHEAIQQAVTPPSETVGRPYARRISGEGETLPARVAEPMLDLNITTALQAFPGAALEARLVAMRLVGPSASVERGSGRSLHTVLQETGQDHRLVLVALNDLVNGRLPGTGQAPTSHLDLAKN